MGNLIFTRLRYLALTALLLTAFMSGHAQTGYELLSSTRGAAAYCITVAGDYLYSGEGNTLSIYDIGPGTSPPYERLFQHRFLSFIDDIIIQENAMYIAANTDGLYMFDISVADLPVQIASWRPSVRSEAVYDLGIKGDTVFVANKSKLSVLHRQGSGFTKIADLIEVPLNVSRIRGVDVQGDLVAFTVATMSVIHGPDDGVHLFNANTLSRVAYHRETYGDHEDVIIDPENQVIHVMAGGQWTSSLPFPFSDPRGHYYVLDIASVDQPVDIYHDTIAGISLIGDSQVIDAELRNDTIWLATRTGDDQVFPLDGNVFVYDVSNLGAIAMIGEVGVGLLHFDLALQGSVMHVSSEWFGIRSIDVTDLSKPQDLGDTETGGWTETTDIHGDLMVQANEGYATQLFDISDPANPEFLRRHVNIENGFNFGAVFSESGDHIFATYLEAGNSSEFRVLDVQTMEVVGDLDFLTGFEDAFVYDTLFVAYATPLLGASYVSFVSVADPLDPFLLATMPMVVNDMREMLDHVAICTDEQLLLIRTTDRSRVDSVDAEGDPFLRIATSGEVAYVVRESGLVQSYLWDAANGSFDHQTTIGTLPLGVPTHLAKSPGLLHAGYTEFGLFALDDKSLAVLDTFRTGLDFIFPFWWELENVQVFGDHVAITEYFGQTTLLAIADSTTSVSESVLEIRSLEAKPNPSTGTFTIDTGEPGCRVEAIRIVGTNGMAREPVPVTDGRLSLDVPAGIYFLRGVATCGTIYVQKIVVTENE